MRLIHIIMPMIGEDSRFLKEEWVTSYNYNEQ